MLASAHKCKHRHSLKHARACTHPCKRVRTHALQGVLPREDGSKLDGSGPGHAWRDASDGSDLAELTWRAAKRVSANLTPALLV